MAIYTPEAINAQFALPTKEGGKERLKLGPLNRAI